MANAIKSIAKYIKRNPDEADAAVLRDFCGALEHGAAFELERLFNMAPKPFDLAVSLLEEWKFDRHIAARRLQKYLDLDED